MAIKRIFLIVLDSCGIGELPDAAAYGDAGSHTLRACLESGALRVPVMESLGLFHIDGASLGAPKAAVRGVYGRMAERSAGKDTTVGHWEISGVISNRPLPTYPNGFPQSLLNEFSRRTGRPILCNEASNGMRVLDLYGEESMRSGGLIVYTSADSVFQIAAHEAVVPIEELHRDCEIARALLCGEHAVGRVIARPFEGQPGAFRRTANRRDFSLAPPAPTMLDDLSEAGRTVLAVGKISDIFCDRGITESFHPSGNDALMAQTIALAQKPFHGLCFVNLVDFDMLYGHRNNVEGYTTALNRFDAQLAVLLPLLGEEDMVMLTADHGCDPLTPSTDHSREYTPFLAYHKAFVRGVNLGTRSSFADIGATVCDLLGVSGRGAGRSFAEAMDAAKAAESTRQTP